jgi:zinc protease
MMPRFIVFLALVLGLSGCAQNPFATQLRPDQLTFPELEYSLPEVSREQLANGMRVYLKEDHELPLVNISVTIGGGSIADPQDKTGLSQLFSAVLETGGTQSISPAQLETGLEDRAAWLSVSSSSYAYNVGLSVHRDDLEWGMRVLADLLRRPGFDDARFELARMQMLESIYRRDDDPGAIAARLLGEATTPGHPFGRSETVAGVGQIERDDLVMLHQRYFHADNVWFAVSGDLGEDELMGQLQEYFGDWSAAGFKADPLPPLPAEKLGQILVADKDLPQTTILMGHRGISKDNPDMYALQVANYILGGGGFNSRLMREVRSNRGLAYSVYSYFSIGRRLPELFLAASETKSESTVEVVKLMLEQMRLMIAQQVSDTELTLAKESLINSFVFAFEDSHSVVSRKVRLEYYDYPQDYMENYCRRLAAVTAEDVQRVAAQYLRPRQLQIVLVGQRAKFYDQLGDIGLPVVDAEL